MVIEIMSEYQNTSDLCPECKCVLPNHIVDCRIAEEEDELANTVRKPISLTNPPSKLPNQDSAVKIRLWDGTDIHGIAATLIYWDIQYKVIVTDPGDETRRLYFMANIESWEYLVPPDDTFVNG
jgi:hypothetical protein